MEVAIIYTVKDRIMKNKRTVLAKLINMAFKLSLDKTEQFFNELNNTNSLQKALDRANKHKHKENKKE